MVVVGRRSGVYVLFGCVSNRQIPAQKVSQ